MSIENIPFKTYSQHQIMLLPPSLEELIPENAPVRVVNSIIDRIDLSSLYETYKGGGTSSYHPAMLLKVLVYAYLENIYSSRDIENPHLTPLITASDKKTVIPVLSSILSK